MATLHQLRMEAGWSLKDLKEASDVSMATLSRIEASGRAQEIYEAQELVLARLVNALSTKLSRPIVIADLEGVVIAPAKTGRPKKAKGETNGEI